MMFFQRYLIADDLLADRLASNIAYRYQLQDLELRVATLEKTRNKPQKDDGTAKVPERWSQAPSE